jgi:hypothetical protein
MFEEMQALEKERGRLAEENRRLEARYEELQRLAARQSTVTGSARLSAAPGRPTSPPSDADRAETTANRTAEEPSTSPSPAPLFGNRGSSGVKPAPPSPPPQTPPATQTTPVETASNPQPEPSAGAYSGPSSGRVIWTGYLRRGDSVTIEGRRATEGTLNGTLPRAPLRVTIYPGDLSGGGLRVYRSYASRNSFEPKSAANGWQATRFVYDAERAGGVLVAQTPSGGNGYKLIFRCIGKPVSVVLIEWRVQH